jgi:hypothetical protein
MSALSEDLRSRAAVDRASAEAAELPNRKATLLASAAKLDELAAHAERAEFLSKGRSGN